LLTQVSRLNIQQTPLTQTLLWKKHGSFETLMALKKGHLANDSEQSWKKIQDSHAVKNFNLSEGEARVFLN